MKRRFLVYFCLVAGGILLVLLNLLQPLIVVSLTTENNQKSKMTVTNHKELSDDDDVVVKAHVYWAPSNISSLCIPQKELMGRDKNSPSSDGLLLVRIPKTGSSTMGGVAARMAHAMTKKYTSRNNDTTANTTVCKSRLTHSWSVMHLRRMRTFSNRNYQKSFLWTMLRDPAQRAISGFYFFDVSKNGVNPNDAIQTLQKKPPNHLLKWVGAKNDTPAGIQQVLHDFNFIGLLERLDESLVVLQLLLELQPQDILYLNAKRSGEYDISNQCRRTPQSVVTPELAHYLSSDEWFHHNRGDYLLYHAVNKSIDFTIESVIGRDVFEQALQTFLQIKAHADKHCQYKSPCIGEEKYRPRDEERSKCYVEDWGCGYECLDSLFENETTWTV